MLGYRHFLPQHCYSGLPAQLNPHLKLLVLAELVSHRQMNPANVTLSVPATTKLLFAPTPAESFD